jgi:hypothetical protein
VPLTQGGVTKQVSVSNLTDGRNIAASSICVNSPLTSSLLFVYGSDTTALDYGTARVDRIASFTGGTPGNVNAGLVVNSSVSANVTSFEWAIVGVLNNSATNGENTGIYGQGNKLTGAGPTWGMVAEARDKSGNANPSSGLVGIEVDVFANGTDTNNTRVGIDLVVGKGVTGTAPTATYGLRVAPQNNDPSNGAFDWGVYVKSVKNYFMGAVGIGVDNPAVKLDVQASGSSDIRALETANNVDVRVSAIGGIGLAGVIGTYSNHPVALYTNGIERVRFDANGNVGIGTLFPSQLLDVNSDSIRVRTAKTPASASATGTQGQIAWDANYLYVCTATNTWKRVALATW